VEADEQKNEKFNKVLKKSSSYDEKNLTYQGVSNYFEKYLDLT